jgi:hypothetical protein
MLHYRWCVNGQLQWNLSKPNPEWTENLPKPNRLYSPICMVNLDVMQQTIKYKSVIWFKANHEDFNIGYQIINMYSQNINRQISQQPENCENRNDPDLVQAFLKKWWVESHFKTSNLPLLHFKQCLFSLSIPYHRPISIGNAKYIKI